METSLSRGNYEVPGTALKSYIEGFKLVRHVPYSILAKHGLVTMESDGEYTYDAKAFFPLESLLAAMRELEVAVGAKKMFEVGLEVPKNAVLPPGAGDIKAAMTLLDIGYHLNHFHNGVPMFDPQRRVMSEGIGHYRCASSAPKRIVMDIDAPYPCELDRGILQGWAARFERTAMVIHLDPTFCRKTGGRSCRYEVTWR